MAKRIVHIMPSDSRLERIEREYDRKLRDRSRRDMRMVKRTVRESFTNQQGAR